MIVVVITPIYLMKEFFNMNSISMYLYHLFKDNSYLNNYLKDKNFKIIDNGVFEIGTLPSDKKYIDLIERLLPDEVIAPDIFGDSKKTIGKTREFIKKIKLRKLNNIRIQAVIQARTIDEAVNCYLKYSCDPDIHCIGFPFKLRLVDGKGVKSRKELIEYLIREGLFNSLKDHHLLGLNSIRELISFSKLKKIRSCDSSLFYIHAKEGIRYDHLIPKGRSCLRIDFYSKGEDKCKENLIQNLKFLKGNL